MSASTELPGSLRRNPELDYSSPRALLDSLERRPPRRQFVRMRQADDHRALAALARDERVARLARGPQAVRLLWEVCQIPDFRNVMDEGHTRLLARIFNHLSGPEQRLPEAWVASQVSALDRPEGEVETLLGRIAHIRTWTYVSHRSSWLADSDHWQGQTRAVEDRLSDALHERLTQRFVDRRAAVLARHDPEDLLAEVTESGEVLVQGLLAGRLDGFRFVPDPEVREESRGLLAAANRALRADIDDRVSRFVAETRPPCVLTEAAHIAWRGSLVARLVAGEDLLSPRVEILPSNLLSAPLREAVRRRLAAWLDELLRETLGPLFSAREAELSGPARGLVFSVTESLGSVSRRVVAPQILSLSRSDRRELAALRLRLGRLAVFMPGLLTPEAIRLRGLLWGVRHGFSAAPPPDGRASAPLDPSLPPPLYAATGYQRLGSRAVRVDRLERLAAAAFRQARQGPFAATRELAAVAGCRPEDLAALLADLGFTADGQGRFARRERRRRGPRRRRP